MKEQIGTARITRVRVYPLDPAARDDGLGTTVVVQPGEYPVFRDGITYYWQMTGRINTGRGQRLGDGLFTLGSHDEGGGDEVTFYSRRFGPDEWADLLREMDVPGTAVEFTLTEEVQS